MRRHFLHLQSQGKRPKVNAKQKVSLVPTLMRLYLLQGYMYEIVPFLYTPRKANHKMAEVKQLLGYYLFLGLTEQKIPHSHKNTVSYLTRYGFCAVLKSKMV